MITRVARVEIRWSDCLSGPCSQSISLEAWFSPETTLGEAESVRGEMRQICQDLQDALIEARLVGLGAVDSRVYAIDPRHVLTSVNVWLDDHLETREDAAAFLELVARIVAPRGYDVSGR